MHPFPPWHPCRNLLFKGGLSGDRSSSEANTTNNTTQTTITQDRRFTAGDGSIVATEGSSINATIESLDARVAEAALKSASDSAVASIAGNVAVNKAAFDFGKDAFREAAGLASDAVAGSRSVAEATLAAASQGNREIVDLTDRTLARMVETQKAASAGGAATLADTLRKIAIAGLLVGGGVTALYVFKRSK